MGVDAGDGEAGVGVDGVFGKIHRAHFYGLRALALEVGEGAGEFGDAEFVFVGRIEFNFEYYGGVVFGQSREVDRAVVSQQEAAAFV